MKDYKFKKGDRVRKVGEGTVPEGSLGTVIEDESQPYVDWDIKLECTYPETVGGTDYKNVHSEKERKLELVTDGSTEKEPKSESKPQFKKGDKVRYVKENSHLPVGSVGVIMEVNKHSIYTQWEPGLDAPYTQTIDGIKYDNIWSIGSFTESLELITLKVGDKVKCVEGGEKKGFGWKLGYEFVIKEITQDSDDLAIHWPVDGGSGVYANGLELVTDKETVKESESESEYKFKKGDIVRFIGISGHPVPKNTLGTVLDDSTVPFVNWDISSSSTYKKEIDGTSYQNVYSVFESDLELVTDENPKYKFKIGDKVKCMTDCHSSAPEGSIGVVVELSILPFVSWEEYHAGQINYDDHDNSYPVAERELELVEQNITGVNATTSYKAVDIGYQGPKRWVHLGGSGGGGEGGEVNNNKKTTMIQKITNVLKRNLSKTLQSQYRAGLINGGFELTDAGRIELLDILAVKNEKELAARADDIIKEEKKANKCS